MESLTDSFGGGKLEKGRGREDRDSTQRYSRATETEGSLLKPLDCGFPTRHHQDTRMEEKLAATI